ncbi:hypothetical protein M422DRAFT_782356 [Sphaerobolus stellatus SS14]|uniref:Uncharacterized protein n=1 Tax=Sphaerobolus stellatus (strain SS14) TaxID=990650 RepID=A0A0C9VEN4_SPHS4|nr:hypothetical protein M422DRAFT_782356 [Sphaerobolus stellatus SS14]
MAFGCVDCASSPCMSNDTSFLQGPGASPDYILTLMQTLEGLRDTLSSTGIIKLNLGKLILPNRKEGVEFTPDALASFSIGLHSSEENEQYAKLYQGVPFMPESVPYMRLESRSEEEKKQVAKITSRMINALHSVHILTPSRRTPGIFVILAGRPNTTLNIKPTAKLLRDFRGPTISKFKSAGRIELDLGSFEIREIEVWKVHWYSFTSEIDKPVLRIRL